MKLIKGFTLLEVIVVIGIVTLLGTIITPITIDQIYFARAQAGAQKVASSIFKQQQSAYNGYEDSGYGVKIFSNKVDLFQGTDYATSGWVTDMPLESVTISSNLGGSDEIVFQKGSLKPSSSGTLVFSYADATVTVVINSEGLIYLIR